MQENSILFYDNAEPEYDSNGRRFVDRIYCFEWDRFTDGDWQELRRVYESLPSWLGYGPAGYTKGCPVWFDAHGAGKSHLSASVEPPGLQIAGDVTDDELEQWHARFVQLTENLPWRNVNNV